MICFGVSTSLSAGRSATSKTSSKVETGWNRSEFRASARSKLRAPVVAIPSVDLHAAHDLVIRDARVSAERRVHLRAVKLEGALLRGSVLHSKEPNCEGFLESRARQLQWLVLRLALISLERSGPEGCGRVPSKDKCAVLLTVSAGRSNDATEPARAPREPSRAPGP
jgi:hypothetical protein